MNKKNQINIEQPLGRILSQMGRNFLSLINKKLIHLDVERNFYALLLIEQGDGEITQQDLADQLNSDKVSIVRIIDYLSEKGYVMREKNVIDKRKYSLVLTKKAKNDLPKIKKALQDVKEITFKGLSSYKIAEFTETLNIIQYNLNK